MSSSTASPCDLLPLSHQKEVTVVQQSYANYAASVMERIIHHQKIAIVRSQNRKNFLLEYPDRNDRYSRIDPVLIQLIKYVEDVTHSEYLSHLDPLSMPGEHPDNQYRNWFNVYCDHLICDGWMPLGEGGNRMAWGKGNDVIIIPKRFRCDEADYLDQQAEVNFSLALPRSKEHLQIELGPHKICVFMKRANGGDLEHLKLETWEQAIQISSGLASAFQDMLCSEMPAHGDLAPGNILLMSVAGTLMPIPFDPAFLCDEIEKKPIKAPTEERIIAIKRMRALNMIRYANPSLKLSKLDEKIAIAKIYEIQEYDRERQFTEFKFLQKQCDFYGILYCLATLAAKVVDLIQPETADSADASAPAPDLIQQLANLRKQVHCPDPEERSRIFESKVTRTIIQQYFLKEEQSSIFKLDFANYCTKLEIFLVAFERDLKLRQQQHTTVIALAAERVIPKEKQRERSPTSVAGWGLGVSGPAAEQSSLLSLSRRAPSSPSSAALFSPTSPDTDPSQSALALAGAKKFTIEAAQQAIDQRPNRIDLRSEAYAIHKESLGQKHCHDRIRIINWLEHYSGSHAGAAKKELAGQIIEYMKSNDTDGYRKVYQNAIARESDITRCEMFDAKLPGGRFGLIIRAVCQYFDDSYNENESSYYLIRKRTGLLKPNAEWGKPSDPEEYQSVTL